MYEHTDFDGRLHLPIAFLSTMRERTIMIRSAGGLFNVSGCKIGWVAAPVSLKSAVRNVQQFLTYVNVALFQPVIARAHVTTVPFYDEIRLRLE